MLCTSGGPGYPIRTSRDLVHWTMRGTAFTAATKPAWATGDFWAPELHSVGNGYVLYFSARHTDNSLAVGAATAPTPFGPFTAQALPLVKETYPGVIDVHEFQSPDGKRWLLWKRDGNAVGQQTPIRIQELSAADGLTRLGSPVDLIVNDQPWEGRVVEGPWMIFEAGYYYLFYSANGYASVAYAIGVARSMSPLGPFTKAAAPLLVSKGNWAGPGHGSVVRGPTGGWVHVFHAWVAGKIGQAPGREVLLEPITFENGWPVMHAAPSSRSQPLP
jgi:beta-xylosidase